MGSNWCRTPIGLPTIWCYISTAKDWEYGRPEVPNCSGEAVHGTGELYRGCLNVVWTRPGCNSTQAWSPIGAETQVA